VANAFASQDGEAMIVLAVIPSTRAFRHEVEKFALEKENVFVASANALRKTVVVTLASIARSARPVPANVRNTSRAFSVKFSSPAS